MQFQRATRRKSYIKIALTGASGAGKTYSALKLAQGLGGRIAVVDTENGSASLYADLGDYDTLELTAPFTTERYQEAIQAAADAGYQVLIIDSLTHAWAGEGGLLAQKEMLDARGGSNTFTNWAPITRKHEAFKAAILQAPLHVIATMRSKTEYVVETQGGSKNTPRKVGTAPIQRDGMEYEFTLVFDLGADHAALPSKDRTSLFAGFHAPLTPAEGRKIAAWLESGAEPLAPSAEPPAAGNSVTIAHGARWRTLRERAKKCGANIETCRPTAEMAPADVEALLATAEGIVAEVERAAKQEAAA